jgi:hypothetical protein
MKKLFLVGLALCLMVPAAYATTTVSFSWEDGVSTIMGSFGNLVDPTNVTGPQNGIMASDSTFTCPGAAEGMYYLHVAEETHSGTPYAMLACITGLADGDTVEVTFYGYDSTPNVSPSWRLWGGYHDAVTCGDCPGTYISSAGEGYHNTGYTVGGGWDLMEAGWVYVASASYSSLVIQGRLYSYPSTAAVRTDYFGDYITVTVPSYAHVTFPDFGPSAVHEASWGGIKALYR